MRCSVFIATSLDGFIARPDGDLDWLHAPDPGADDVDGQSHGDPGYDDLIAEVDVIVMGRATYDTVLGFGIGWPYPRPVVVLTSRDLDDVPDGADVRAAQGDVGAVVQELERDGFTHAYVDGGAVVQQFLAADLIDRLTVTTVPVLLGDGIRLFGSVPEDRWFRPDPPRILSGGLVQTTWHRAR